MGVTSAHQARLEGRLQLPVGHVCPVGVLEERVRLDGVGVLRPAAEPLLLLALPAQGEVTSPPETAPGSENSPGDTRRRTGGGGDVTARDGTR